MLFIKPNNFDLYKSLLYPIGMSHGVLFIGYVIVATLLKKSQNWNFKNFAIIQLASYPLWYFLCREKYCANV
jgi:integral membrane protein